MSSLLAVFLLAGVSSLVMGIFGSWAGPRAGFKVARKLGTGRPAVSTLGGMGFLSGVWIGLALVSYSGQPDPFLSADEMVVRARGIGVATLFMFVWGLWLDWRPPSRYRWWLLAGQVVAGGVLFWFGFEIRELSLGRWAFETGMLSLPLTLLWIVLVINFLRFFDGIDGLFTAVGIIVVVFHYLGIGEREYFVRLLCAVFGGALGGLFLVTVYPARIYLGYNGSSLPGICLGALTLASRTKTITTETIFVPVAVLIVVAAFGLLLFVESRILIRRGRVQL